MEKKTVRISLSTLFLIIAIIIIIIMGYFIYKISKEKAAEIEEVATLNNEIVKMEATANRLQENIDELQENVSKQNENASEVSINEDAEEIITKKTYSYNDIKGWYTYEKILTEDDSYGVFYHLYLSDNGTFSYTNCFIASRTMIGNYIIEGDNIILNKWFQMGSDVEMRTTTGKIVLKINSDGSISDTNKLIELGEKYQNVDLSNVTLKRDSSEKMKDEPDINKNINDNYVIQYMDNKN